MATIADYKYIQNNLFIRIDIDQYRTTSSGAFTSKSLLFTDSLTSRTFGRDTYVALGNFMSVSNVSSELKVSSSQVSITISGIPNTSIAEIMYSRIKTSKVNIFRALFDPSTGNLLPITPNPIGRFSGIVTNWTLSEEWDSPTKTSSNTLILTCASQIDILNKKIAGRKTSPSSMKKYYPSDASMDRVPVLEKATFDFGKQSSTTTSVNAQNGIFSFLQ